MTTSLSPLLVMFKPFLFLHVLVSTVRAEPKFIPLNKLSPLVISTITNVEGGANVYLASKDDDKYLKNIFLTTGDNTYTLDELNDFDDNGTPKSIQAAGDLTISTTNEYDTTTRLTGFIYVTTKVQALDPNFLVYVIKTSNSISVSGTNATAVILNTKLNSETADADEPLKTSYVTEITQSPSTNINFQWGLPSDDWHDDTNNTFFQNPIKYANFDTTFLNHIEPLQIGLDLWYFTVTGTVKMRIENKYVSNHDYTTTAVSTTDLIVGNNVYQEHVVNFQRDDPLSGTSGLITTAFVQTSDLTTFMQYNSNSIKTEYNHEIAIGNLDFTRQQPIKLTISSTSLLPGTFYCQYFTITGGVLPTTTPQTTTLGPSTTAALTSTVPSSTTTVATTTKENPVMLRLECMPTLLLFIFLILGVAADPKVLYLKKLSSYSVQNVEGGANLYLASNDDWMYLKNINITTGGKTYTLDKLLLLNDDSSPASIPIAGDLSISTTNNETVTAKLSGFFYVTTALQAKDPTFHVFVVQPTQSVSVTGMKSTVVILNTLLRTFTDGDQPTMTSYVTKINQSPNTAIYFQWGIPSADWKTVTNNTFFRNPIVLTNQTATVQKFFDNVEPLQIGLDYWYFTVMGPVNMYIENKYVSNHDYKTTAASTTGVIINNFLYWEHIVSFQPDETRGGASGYITSAFLYDDSYLNITLLYATSNSQKVYIGSTNIGVLSWDNKQAYKLAVNTNSTIPGTFFCQYFSFAEDVLPPPQTSTMTPSTVSSATSTTTVATTTKGSSVVFSMEFFALILMALCLQ